MTAEAAAVTLRACLAALDVSWEEPSEGSFVVTLPGTHKLQTTCALVVGPHAVSVNAFVARHPDENHEGVHRWLLEQNIRTYAVAFAVDRLGDIYLAGKIPLVAVSAEEIDRVLGAVLEYADASFDTILKLGFASSIRREWEWRRKRGESTRNLEAFRHLAPPEDQTWR
jgi:Putative bacterial sensory transduction regulator